MALPLAGSSREPLRDPKRDRETPGRGSPNLSTPGTKNRSVAPRMDDVGSIGSCCSSHQCRQSHTGATAHNLAAPPPPKPSLFGQSASRNQAGHLFLSLSLRHNVVG